MISAINLLVYLGSFFNFSVLIIAGYFGKDFIMTIGLLGVLLFGTFHIIYYYSFEHSDKKTTPIQEQYF